MSVGKVGPANAGYYQSAVVRGAEDYYAGDGDAPGRWVGRADLVVLSPAVWRLPLTPGCCWRQRPHPMAVGSARRT